MRLEKEVLHVNIRKLLSQYKTQYIGIEKIKKCYI